jgi:ABC-type uncharacterized transport system substrate-binding protein
MENYFSKHGSSSNIDAYWVLADNYVINAQSLVKFWIKKVKGSKKPIIAPIEMLASSKIGAAVFTADPDYFLLGVQLAGQILQVLEEDTGLDEIGFEPPISVKTVVNLQVAEDIGLDLDQERLNKVNKIVK